MENDLRELRTIAPKKHMSIFDVLRLGVCCVFGAAVGRLGMHYGLVYGIVGFAAGFGFMMVTIRYVLLFVQRCLNSRRQKRSSDSKIQ